MAGVWQLAARDGSGMSVGDVTVFP
jgi:hypothetical protein